MERTERVGRCAVIKALKRPQNIDDKLPVIFLACDTNGFDCPVFVCFEQKHSVLLNLAPVCRQLQSPFSDCCFIQEHD